MFSLLNNKQKHGVEVSPSIVIFTVFFLLGLYFIFYIHQIILLIFLAYLLMVALNPAVNKIQKKIKLPRPVSIFLVYVLLIISIVLITGLIIPPLVTQLQQMLKTIELPALQEQISSFQFSFSEIGEILSQLGNSFNLLVTVITSTFTSIFTFLTLMVISFYLLMERPRLHRKIHWLTNKKEHMDSAKKFLDSLDHQLGGWVRGQIILMSAVGVITFIGLLLFSIPYSLPLALIAGILEIIPNLGPTIAAVPAIALAIAFHGWGMGGVILLLYIVIQQVENNFLVPQIMSKNAHVSPLPAIISMLIGFKIFGIAGALLSIPMYIIFRTIWITWFKKH